MARSGLFPVLNSDQQRYLLGHLAVIERDLTATLAAVSADGDVAVFPPYRSRLAPQAVARLHARLETLRAAMRRFLESQGIPVRNDAKVDARWALQTQLALLRTLVVELRPNYVRGYGVLDEDAMHACQGLAAELGLLLDGFDELLRPAPMAALQFQVGDDWARVLGELIETYGLAEYRLRWHDLAEPAEQGRIEVAVLGRVSSGKSSLINALAGYPWLPVAAMPVTAITTRLRYAASPALDIIGLDGAHASARPEELATFVSETGNPENRRRLAEVRLGVPAPLLHAGVTLTDTPGLGSLHAAASRHASEYLPRCDLGIVAVDATATLTQQDIDLLRALEDSGAGVLLVLTKGDLLAASAQAEQRNYIRTALAAALGHDVELALISTQPAWRAAFDAWVTETLLPRVQRGREAAVQRRAAQRARLTREIRLLLEQIRDERPPSDAATRNFAQASLDLQQTEERLGTWIEQLQRDAIPQAAETAVNCWLMEKAPLSLADMFAAELAARLHTAAHDARAQLLEAAVKFSASDQWQRQLPALPAFAPAPLPPASPDAWYGRVARRMHAHHRLQPLREASEPQLREYAGRLRAWLHAAVDGLRAELRRGTATATVVDPQRLAGDIQRLQALEAGTGGDVCTAARGA